MLFRSDEAERALCALATREDEDPLVRLAALRALDALEVGLPCEQLASMLADPLLGPLALFLLAFDGRQEVLLDVPRDRPVVVYCSVGYRSSAAAKGSPPHTSRWTTTSNAPAPTS